MWAGGRYGRRSHARVPQNALMTTLANRGPRSIRFGVKDPYSGLCSETWKVWVGSRKRDVYLVCRAIGRDIKLSLHESGRWHFAFQRPDAFDDETRPTSKFVGEYQRPTPVAGVPTLAVQVHIPWFAATLAPASEQADDTVWIPPAIQLLKEELAETRAELARVRAAASAAGLDIDHADRAEDAAVKGFDAADRALALDKARDAARAKREGAELPGEDHLRRLHSTSFAVAAVVPEDRPRALKAVNAAREDAARHAFTRRRLL